MRTGHADYLVYISLQDLVYPSGLTRGVHVGSFAPNPHTSVPPYFAGVGLLVYQAYQGVHPLHALLLHCHS